MNHLLSIAFLIVLVERTVSQVQGPVVISTNGTSYDLDIAGDGSTIVVSSTLQDILVFRNSGT